MTNEDDDFVIMNRTRVWEEKAAVCLKVRYQFFFGQTDGNQEKRKVNRFRCNSDVFLL